MHREGIAGEDVSIFYKLTSVPLLDLPVAEDIAFFIVRRSRFDGDRFCSIHIEFLVTLFTRFTRQRTFTRNIVQVNAFSADELAAPFGIQVYLADGGRPPGIDLRFLVKLAVFAYRRLIDAERIKVIGMLQGFVGIPSDQIEIDPLAADITDLLAVFHPELLRLAR